MAKKSSRPPAGKRIAKPPAAKPAAPRKAAVTPPRLVLSGPATPPVLIAGVGASAGGLEAFSQLLQAIPENPNLALVLVQHLAPHHESALPGLLAARTNMTVVQAAEGMVVEANHVYVIPPNVQ